ncbi:hypothetical protein AMS68_002552 [Peltaster fructicola]|uniref:PAS domain-containing protein n=1 Tax=Peltaster fructicola TaxID=286661 RepID=A0A6H0XQX1_9PEZI|nr:hypothetical protein AMS68_002552 [Peltaster fructicola]
MSLYHSNDGGLANNMAATATDLSMLDQNAALLDDLDMSLPMDLDVDLSQVSADPNPFAGLQAQNGLGLDQNQSFSVGADSSVNGLYGATPGSMQQQDVSMSGAGAGPLPTGFGLAPQNSSSTLTEFTKRRNWSQRIIEELRDFLHILTQDGRILYVSPSCKNITGHESQNLVGKFIGEFVHPDDAGIFMREFNESIASGHALRFFYRFKKEDGSYIIFECDGHPHISTEPQGGNSAYGGNQQGNMGGAGMCRGFFMMARPYPTKNAALLDSFLEHKIENERLMKRIEELKREEVEENAEQDRLYREQAASVTGATPSEPQQSSRVQDTTFDPPVATPNYQGMPPPAKPSISNTALTRQNLDSALSAQKPDSIADKMSRYEASSNHLESIELLTGLRYRDGERSHGISTGDTSPALIRGDAGIAILLDRDRDGSKKREEESSRLQTRPKTLCNACGLRWAKKEKKRGGDDGKNMSPASTSGQQNFMSGQTPMGVMGGLAHPPGLPMNNSTGSS